MDRETPTFNLKAVVRETGIKPDTLRAWERRYGLPEPDRSAGGHRLYSQRDIDTLLWLMARQEEGLTISRAVDLWRSIEAESRDPLRTPEYSLNTSSIPIVEGEELKRLSARWLDACLKFDERAAERVLVQAFAIYPVEIVCTEILQKSLQSIGKGWYEGTVSVQQEHFASALAMRHIEALLRASPPPTRTGRLMLVCAPNEEHAFGLALLHLLLRRQGWETIYLGANIPIDDLEKSTEAVRPKLVIISAQRLQTAASLKTMAEALWYRQVSVGFAGRIFTLIPQIRKRIPGHFLGETIGDALTRVEALAPVAPAVPEPVPLADSFNAALLQFQIRQPDINARVVHLLNAHGATIPPVHVATANFNMAQLITAALTLGDMHFIDLDIGWIDGLLANYHIDRDHLLAYLAIYAQAIRENLGPEGQPILDWFATVL